MAKRGIRVYWEEGINGRVINMPYSNVPVGGYAIVSPAQLAAIKRKKGEYLNLRILDRAVEITRDTPLWTGEGGFR